MGHMPQKNLKFKETIMKEAYSDLCKACYIHVMKPSKKEIKKIVMTPYETECERCHKTKQVVDYVEDD